MKRVLAVYGAHPLHALALLGCFALAGVAALQLAEVPRAGRIALWLLGAAVAHDLVLYPLYLLADRGLLRVRRLRGSVNWVRVPALLSGLLLLVFLPTITQRSERAYRFASGQDHDPYLERWLALSAALFLGSALLFALTTRRPPKDQALRARDTPAGAPGAAPR